MTTFRGVFLVGFLACVGMLAVAGYFQFVENMEPCPLCIFQRVLVLIAGMIFLLGALHNPVNSGRRFYAFLLLLASAAGAAIAGRHVWLQSLPADQVPSCGPGLNFMLDNFPLSQTLSLVLKGSGECAEVAWRFLGLSIPGWTLVAFIIMILVALWQLFAKHQRQNFI